MNRMGFDAPFPSTDFDWPMFGLADDVRPALAAARRQHYALALATLYAAEGGAPRGIGAQMVFKAEGAIAGFLSGGCVEADVALHAQAVLADGVPRRLTYGEGGPLDIALPCGSRIEVLVERLAPDNGAVARLLDLAEARTPALWASDGLQQFCAPEGDAAPGFTPVVRRRYAPPIRAVVVGGDPAALAAARLMSETGVAVTLVRPKGPDTAPPFAIAAYLRDDAAAAIVALQPDPWTAVCIMTHDLAVEHAATAAALTSAAGYVGVLGSRRRAPERQARLAAAGFGADDLARLHAPIGLPIGGKAPWDIAIAVAAEVVQRLAAPADSA
jgi:xanthine dehydrogenase accessory factor